jgi:hypothetical protein
MPAGQKSLQLRFKYKAFGASLRYLVQDSGNIRIRLAFSAEFPAGYFTVFSVLAN